MFLVFVFCIDEKPMRSDNFATMECSLTSVLESSKKVHGEKVSAIFVHVHQINTTINLWTLVFLHYTMGS